MDTDPSGRTAAFTDARRGCIVVERPVPGPAWTITSQRLDALAPSSTRAAIVARDEAQGIILEEHAGAGVFVLPRAERCLAVWVPVLEELSAAHALNITHGDLAGALSTVDGFIVVRGLGLPREPVEDDAVALGGSLESLAAHAGPNGVFDLVDLGRRLRLRELSIADAAAEARDAHVRIVAASGFDALVARARHAAPIEKALDELDERGLLSSTTIPTVSRVLGPALVNGLHAGTSRRHVRLLARLPLTELLVERADDGAASIGARIAALRVLEHSAAPPVDDLVRLLNDPIPVVAAAARRALLRARSPVVVSRRGAAWMRCPHPWGEAMDDENAARTRVCPSCDARVASVLEMGALVDAKTPIMILEGPEGRHVFAMIGEEVTVGRSPECDVAIGNDLIPPMLLRVRSHDAGTFVTAEEPITIERHGQRIQTTSSPALGGDDAILFHGFTMRFGFTEDRLLGDAVTLPMGPTVIIEPFGRVLLLGSFLDADWRVGVHPLAAVVEKATRGIVAWSVDAPVSHAGADGLDFAHIEEESLEPAGVLSVELRKGGGGLELVSTAPGPIADVLSGLEPVAGDIDTIEDGAPVDG